MRARVFALCDGSGPGQVDQELGFTIQFWLRIVAANPNATAACSIVSDRRWSDNSNTVIQASTFIGLDSTNRIQAAFWTGAWRAAHGARRTAHGALVSTLEAVLSCPLPVPRSPCAVRGPTVRLMSTALAGNVPHFIAVRFDGVAGTLSIWVNSTIVGSSVVAVRLRGWTERWRRRDRFRVARRGAWVGFAVILWGEWSEVGLRVGFVVSLCVGLACVSVGRVGIYGGGGGGKDGGAGARARAGSGSHCDGVGYGRRPGTYDGKAVVWRSDGGGGGDGMVACLDTFLWRPSRRFCVQGSIPEPNMGEPVFVSNPWVIGDDGVNSVPCTYVIDELVMYRRVRRTQEVSAPVI